MLSGDMEISQESLEQVALTTFTESFGTPPETFILSPGRVNLIGDHTDYNGGFVLPMAIDRFLVMAMKPRKDDRVCVVSLDFQDSITLSLADLKRGRFSWGEYISGSLWALKDQGYKLSGFDAVITSNIPLGASLSSSAALELAVVKAAAYAGNIQWNPMGMALICQKAENHWVGMNCGIMDQAICAGGKVDHAAIIDCRSLNLTHCPVLPNCSVIVLDTSTRRELVESAYNERRKQCMEAASIMGIELLRDADLDMLARFTDEIPPIVYKRAKHVISENERVVQAVESMKRGDAAAMGRLMYESHKSLCDDYEVSSEALNTMVDCAMEHPACLGARMTGAGFGGCTVALVNEDEVELFMKSVETCYQKRMGLRPVLYKCRAADGTSIKPVQ